MQKSPMYKVAIAAAALILTANAAACGSNNSSASSTKSTNAGATIPTTGSYKLVLISDLSGPYSSVSGPGAAGAQVAVNDINASGGVNGKTLSLDVIDSQSTSTAALAAAQKAVSENPHAVMMFSGSAGASAITSLVQSAGVPFLSPGLGDSSVYPAQSDLYQPSLTAKQDAEALFEFVQQKLGGNLAGKTVDVAAISSPYVDVIMSNAKSMLTGAGAKVGSVERYSLPLASFSTQAAAISRDNPAAVLVLGSTNDTVVVAKALSAAGVSALEVGIPSGAGQSTVQQVGSANYYGLTANPYPSALPAFLSVADKYGKKTDVSGSIFSMSGWVAAYAVADALKICGANCNGQALNSALEHVSNYTVPGDVSYGPVSFSPSNHVAVNVVRFHSYDPATGSFAESASITLP